MAKPIGSLGRANELILGDRKSKVSSVYSLQHWHATSGPPSRDQYSNTKTAPEGNEEHHHNHHHVQHKAQMLFVRAQESALDFLLGYFKNNNNNTDGSSNPPVRARAQAAAGRQGGNNKSEVKKKKLTRSEFVIGQDVPNLPDHHWSTIIQFIFWRWLTFANAIEFLLMIGLFCGCVQQCLEILGEYYTYPSHVSVTRSTNDDFRRDIPGLTLCNNNRMSKSVVKRNFPALNYTHFRAMSFNSFRSPDNFSLPADVLRRLQANETDTSSDVVDDSLNDELEKVPADYLINWVLVARHFSNRSLARFHKFFPDYDLIEKLTCANVWGDPMPCENLKRIESIQKGMCVTLFHDSVFWDPGDPAVRQLEGAMSSVPRATMPYSMGEDGIPVLKFDKLASQDKMRDELKDDYEDMNVKVEDPTEDKDKMGYMEMIRLKLDFRSSDYMVQRSLIGGVLAIHSNSIIANLEHIMYIIEPGFWYSYYIQRTDYDRLPPPYDTNCYDYQKNRQVHASRMRTNFANRLQIKEYIRRQASKPKELQEDYVRYLRQRSLSGVSFGFGKV